MSTPGSTEKVRIWCKVHGTIFEDDEATKEGIADILRDHVRTGCKAIVGMSVG